jgi:putative ABC transport system permease protein
MQSFADTLGEVFRAMMANKLRTFLTMFGIAWGVGSLLVLVGLGEGFRSGQRRNLASVGNDVVMMWSATIPALPNQHTAMRPYKLTLKDEADMRKLPALRSVTAILNRQDLYQVSAWSNTSSQVMGVEPNFAQVRFAPIEEGRFLDAADLSNRRRVAVLGPKTAHLLFPGHPMIGETITINGTSFTVVGRVGTTARGNNDFDDQKVYIPISTMQELFAMKGENIPQDALTSLQYQPTIKADSTAAIRAVHQVISANHGFDPSLKEAFDEWDTIHTSKLVDKIFDAMDVFLGGVGLSR